MQCQYLPYHRKTFKDAHIGISKHAGIDENVINTEVWHSRQLRYEALESFSNWELAFMVWTSYIDAGFAQDITL